MLAGLNHKEDEWLSDFFAELIKEMELWKWDNATGVFWSRPVGKRNILQAG